MRNPAPIRAIAIRETVPLGDVTLPPALATGRSELEFARALSDAVRNAATTSASEIFRRFRNALPGSGMRGMALAAVKRFSF
jgi:hypothetical protein